MKKFITLLFVGTLNIAFSMNAMTHETTMPKTSKKSPTKSTKYKKGKYARRFGKQAKRFKGKITSVSLKALDPNQAGEEVMGWLNPQACGATGIERCAIVNDPQGTHFVKEVSTRGRKGNGYIGDAEGAKRHVSGKVLRVYKKTAGSEPFMASESSAYKERKTYKSREAGKSAKSRRKSPSGKTEQYRKYTKSNGGKVY